VRLAHLWCFIWVFILASCATSPLGRNQFIIVSDSSMNQMGAQAFDQIKAKEKVESSPEINSYVACVVTPLVRKASPEEGVKNWEVVVFRNSAANAFALPGGKIGVYTGLLKVAKTDAQLAAVVGHEIGHVQAKHGAERVSQQAGTDLGLSALGSIVQSNPNSNLLIGLLGVGAQVGVLLPFSRIQESEADLIGLDLMADAGFEPSESVELWKNMMTASGGKGPPEWLSTHPASENRIANLNKNMPGAKEKFGQAQHAGQHPQCDRSRLRL